MEKNPQETLTDEEAARWAIGPNPREKRPVAIFDIPAERCLRPNEGWEQKFNVLRMGWSTEEQQRSHTVWLVQELVQRAINVLDFVGCCPEIADDLEEINTKLKLANRR